MKEGVWATLLAAVCALIYLRPVPVWSWSFHGTYPMIPGKGCGTRNELKVREKLSHEDDIHTLECTIVRDLESFRTFYSNVVPSKWCSDCSVHARVWLFNVDVPPQSCSQTNRLEAGMAHSCKQCKKSGICRHMLHCLVPALFEKTTPSVNSEPFGCWTLFAPWGQTLSGTVMPHNPSHFR